MKRLIYFGYYIKKLNWKLFKKFLKYTKEKTGRSTYSILLDVFICSMRYNTSILEYFQFHFYELDDPGRRQWAGTGYMYEFHKVMNPPQYRYLLEDKTTFFRDYSKYMIHKVADIIELKKNPSLIDQILNNKSGKIVFKIKDGGCGEGVLVKNTSDFNTESLIPFMISNNYDLVEDFILQHPVINSLAPSAVNTVRVITQLSADNEVIIIGCRLRISINGFVDNLAAGNIAAPIDTVSGIINGIGVYSDITKPDTDIQPITGVHIKGIQIPFWSETIKMIKELAKVNTINRSVGWDIAITTEGPDLIEGNREWCKLLFQLPVKKGLKSELDFYLNEYVNQNKNSIDFKVQ